MAFFKTLTVTGSLVADRLIGNADTATSIKKQAVSGSSLATLSAGSYTYIADSSISFTDLPAEIQGCNFNLEVIAISDTNKYQIIEAYKELSNTVSEYLLIRNIINNQASTWFNMGYSAVTFTVGEHLKLLVNDEETQERTFNFKLGEDYKIEVVPVDSTYKVESFVLDGAPIESPYTFKVANSSYVFNAVEALNEATVNVTSAEGITIKINDVPVESGAHQYTIGQELTITTEIDEAYNMTSLKLDNEDIISGHVFTLTAAGASITATSAIKMYFIKVFNPENATIYINNQSETEYTFQHGTEITVNAVPDEGYEIARLDISNPEDIYKLTIPESDAYTYTITNVTDGEPGVVEELKSEGYNAGTLLKVNFEATEAYDLTNITKDGRDYVNGSTFVVNYDNTFDVTTSNKMCNVRVIQPEVGGHIEINGETGTSFDFAYGTEITIESVPDSGYTVDGLYVSNATDTYAVNIDSPNATVNITSDKEPDANGKYFAGTKITYNITPNENYDITSIIVNGREATTSGSFYINYDSSITVTASIQMLNIAVTQPENARIEINGQVGTSFDFPKGTEVKIEAIPDDGYIIDHLYVTEVD